MYFRCTLPGLKVVYPSTAYDAKGLLKSAIRDNNPVLFFEHKFLYRRVKEDVPAGDYTVPISARPSFAVKVAGYNEVSVTRPWRTPSLEAAQQLSKEGIEAEVIDLRTLLPLDREAILNSVKGTNRLLIVHEDTRTGGIAGEIAAIVCESAFEHLDAPIMRVTALDTPVPYAPPLEERFLPNVEKVVAAARELAKY